MTTWNHAYTLAFSVPNCRDEDSEYTVVNERDRVIAALLRRVAEIIDHHPDELAEALGRAFDTYQEEN